MTIHPHTGVDNLKLGISVRESESLLGAPEQIIENIHYYYEKGLALIFENNKLVTIDIFEPAPWNPEGGPPAGVHSTGQANPIYEGIELFGMEYAEIYGYFLRKDKDLVSDKNGFTSKKLGIKVVDSRHEEGELRERSVSVFT